MLQIKFCNKPRSLFCYCSLLASISQNFVNTLASTITVVIGFNREKTSFVLRGVNNEDVEPSECAPKLFLILLRLEPVRVRAARAPPAAPQQHAPRGWMAARGTGVSGGGGSGAGACAAPVRSIRPAHSHTHIRPNAFASRMHAAGVRRLGRQRRLCNPPDAQPWMRARF